MPVPRSKADIGLYLTPDVLSLPYPPATRLVLAEAISLHQSGGECTASDGHFVKRLGISRDTASRAVQQLVADGILSRAYSDTGRYGITRHLTPTHHYPQNQAAPARDYPQNQATTTRTIRRPLPAKSGPNTTEKGPEKTTPTRRSASRRVSGASFQSQEGQPDAGAKVPAPDSSSTIPPMPAGTAALTGACQPSGSWQKTMEQQQNATRHAPATDPAATTQPGAADQAEHFAAFWDAWPTKQRRKDAAAAFAQLPPDDQQQAAARAARWLQQHPRQVARGATPHPATWLRGEQWTDGPEPKDRSARAGQSAAGSGTARTNAAATIKRQQEGDWK